MAVTVGYQTWDAANWDWDSAVAGKPVPEICAALSSWITTINGNASQSGKQLSLVRDENSSTTANYRGFVVQAPLLQSATRSMYWQMHTTNTTTLACRAYDDDFWSDTTTNGGYGGTSTGTSVTSYFLGDSKSFLNTVASFGDVLIASEVENGKEFFLVAHYLDSDAAKNDSFLLAKDVFGNWCVVTVDGTAWSGAFYDPSIDRVVACTTISTAVTSDSGSATKYVDGKVLMYSPNPTVGATPNRRMSTAIASDALSFNSTSPAVYGYADLGSNVYAVNTTTNGPYVRYTQV